MNRASRERLNPDDQAERLRFLKEETAACPAWRSLISRSDRLSALEEAESEAATPREILHQPWTWLRTFSRLKSQLESFERTSEDAEEIVFSGAGSSHFVGACLEPYLQGRLGKPVRAVSTTDLILDSERLLDPHRKGVIVSVSRSGQSPETIETIRLVREQRPRFQQILLTCNEEARLARESRSRSDIDVIALDPFSCDQGLAMTSSFTSLVLGGVLLGTGSDVEAAQTYTASVAGAGRDLLRKSGVWVEQWQNKKFERVCLLGSGALRSTAAEGALKILEMTDGLVATLSESFLGIRHGPLSFINEKTLIIYFLSSDERRAHYESDLVREIASKRLGSEKVGVGYRPSLPFELQVDHFFELGMEPPAVQLEDDLRPMLDIILAQTVALALCLGLGLNPDHPSPRGTIGRVVQGVTIYP